MNTFNCIFSAWLLVLPGIAHALPLASPEPDNADTAVLPFSSTTVTSISTSTPLSTTSTITTSSTSTLTTATTSSRASTFISTSSTTTASYDVTSLLSSLASAVLASSTPATSLISSTLETSPIGSDSATNSGLPTTDATTGSGSHPGLSSRNLVIVLSSVFGAIALALILAGLYLLRRRLDGRHPFGRRGATPINDDEIATWRASGTADREKSPGSIIEKEPIPMMLDPVLGGISHSAWSWPTPSSPTLIRPLPQSIFSMSDDTPSLYARAPNSRTGLTDESIPGADPFIPPLKRQISRLSKGPRGHGRSKSRRSSMSGKSVMSFQSFGPPLPPHSAGGSWTPQHSRNPTWYDPDDEDRWKSALRDSDYPGTPISLVPGGLSPRPPSGLKAITGRTVL